jgi:hypothetical protein
MDYDQLGLIINDATAKNYSIKFSLISRVFLLNEKLTTDIAENLKFNEKLNWMVIFFYFKFNIIFTSILLYL